MRASARKRRWVAVVVAIIAVCVLVSRRPALPGSLGVMATELRVGMSRDEAVGVIRAGQTADETAAAIFDATTVYPRSQEDPRDRSPGAGES